MPASPTRALAGRRLRLDELSENGCARRSDANLFGALWTARACFAALREHGPRPDGHVRPSSSSAPPPGASASAATATTPLSKAGMYGLVRTLKNEIVAARSYGRVNLVEPVDGDAMAAARWAAPG